MTRELSLSSGDKLWFLVDWPSGHIEIIANVTVPLSDEDKATLGRHWRRSLMHPLDAAQSSQHSYRGTGVGRNFDQILAQLSAT